MMMSEAIRYAMIKDGKVENVCLWDGDVSKWTPPDDMEVIPAPDHIGVGWTYDGVSWSPPVVEEPAPSEIT